jgi:hypothetical protein
VFTGGAAITDGASALQVCSALSRNFRQLGESCHGEKWSEGSKQLGVCLNFLLTFAGGVRFGSAGSGSVGGWFVGEGF